MSGYLNIADPAFDRLITLRDAYRVMEHFVARHVNRGVVDTDVFLAHVELLTDGVGSDPAALYEYLESVAAVVAASGAGGADTAAAAS